MTTPVSPEATHSTLDIPLAEAFAKSACVVAHRIAVDSGQAQITYAQLNAVSDRLAGKLVEFGTRAGDRTAVLMAHDAPLIAALVGAIKAGQVVLALNPPEPLERLLQLVEDAAPSVVVTDAENVELARRLAGPGVAVLQFDLDDELAPEPFSAVAVDAGQTAMLVYTGGSTGRPKGVMKTHRQIVRNVAAHTDAMQYSRADRIPLFSSIGSGQGATIVWCALLNGATLCPFSIRKQGFSGLAAWISNLRLTVYVSSASIFRALVKSLDRSQIFTNIRAVRLASESVTTDDLARLRLHFAHDAIFVHTLSSSETGNIAWSRWLQSDSIPAGRIPVGHVSRDIEVLLLDENGKPVAAGDIGEISVRSRYTAAGYWGDEALTEERFSRDLDRQGTRLVRNGDLARINARGLLEYWGRKDNRLKIRGNRIELSEVEHALAMLAGVENVAAVAVPREGSEPILVAFVVLSPESGWSIRRLRDAATARLPLQMLPSRIVILDAMPLGAGGKVDRERLRLHQFPQRSLGDPPRGATEVMLADVWAEVLNIDTVSRDDDFFEAGGDSLTGAVVSAHVHAAFGIELGLATLAGNPTLAALAVYVDAERERTDIQAPIAAVPRNGPMPLSLFQERVWRAVQRTPSRALAIRCYDIAGPLDVVAFEETFRFLVERHEILRTTFPIVDGQRMQMVHEAAPLGLALVDLSGDASPEEAADHLFKAEAAKPMDVEVLPVTRLLVARLGPERHLMLRVGHSFGQDGFSFATILREFNMLYDAKMRGFAPPLSNSMPLQYVDYAVWHRERMRPDRQAYRDTIGWWKQLFAKRIRTTRLTHRRKIRPGVQPDPNTAVQPWLLDKKFCESLDATARRAGATPFIIRLACFVALVATLTGRETVAIGTGFTNRQRSDTRNIAGLFTNLVPLVFTYRPGLAFPDWVQIVRDRVFETEKHAELPLEEIYDRLRESGLRPPSIRMLFNMTADWSEERTADLVIRRYPSPSPEMPWGFQVYFDPRTPGNCRVEFDARLYKHHEVQAITARFVRVLEVAAKHPNLTMGDIVSSTHKGGLRRIAAYLRSLNAAIR
jgi:amino acid adenylation domain-containing protein